MNMWIHEKFPCSDYLYFRTWPPELQIYRKLHRRQTADFTKDLGKGVLEESGGYSKPDT